MRISQLTCKLTIAKSLVPTDEGIFASKSAEWHRRCLRREKLNVHVSQRRLKRAVLKQSLRADCAKGIGKQWTFFVFRLGEK